MVGHLTKILRTFLTVVDIAVCVLMLSAAAWHSKTTMHEVAVLACWLASQTAVISAVILLCERSSTMIIRTKKLVM